MKRIKVFLPVFVLVLLVGVFWSQSQPIEYRSEALLRISLGTLEDPLGYGGGYTMEDLQRLTSRELMVSLHQRLQDDGLLVGEQSGLKVDDLFTIVQVTPVGAEQVRLSTRGKEAVFLAALLERWIALYKESVEKRAVVTGNKADDDLKRQDAIISDQLQKQQQRLEAFREEFDLVAIDRSDAEVMARFKRLNTAVDSAQEEEARAVAAYNGIKQSIAQGIPAVRPEDRRELQRLQARVKQLSSRMEDLRQRFTDTYIGLNPTTREVREQYQEAVAELEQLEQSSAKLALLEAQQEVVQARSTLDEFRRRLEEQKKEAKAYASRYAEYEALQDEVIRLSEAKNALAERLSEMVVQGEALVTRVTIEEKPFVPETARKTSLQSSLITYGLLALLIAYLVTKLAEFLSRPLHQEKPPVQIYQNIGTTESMTALPAEQRQAMLAAQQAATALPESIEVDSPTAAPQLALQAVRTPRELTFEEIRAMLRVASPVEEIVVYGLLHGVDATTLTDMDMSDWDAQGGVLNLPGQQSRRLPVSPAFQKRLSTYVDHSAVLPLLCHTDGRAMTEIDLQDLLLCLAHDAGIADSDSVSVDAMLHSYALWMVRQGLKLGDLQQLMSSALPQPLMDYRQYSPGGAARPLDEVERFYPL